jgi:predicted secreted Zn-dependent protease
MGNSPSADLVRLPCSTITTDIASVSNMSVSHHIYKQQAYTVECAKDIDRFIAQIQQYRSKEQNKS